MNNQLPFALLAILCFLSGMSQAQINEHYTFNFAPEKSQSATIRLSKIVTQAQACPTCTIIIAGHTDDVGTPEANLALAEARANNIRQQLEQQGIATNQIKTMAWGASQPIASNVTTSGKAQNRRVDIRITDAYAAEMTQAERLQKKLHQLIDKEGQEHLIDPSESTVILAKQGTIVRIPANAFGGVAKGEKITIKVTEVFKKSDMILYNLGTISDGKPLETGGMIKVEAFANGKQLDLLPNKEIQLEVPTNDPQKKMQHFEAQTVNNNINWVNPKPLNIVNQVVGTNANGSLNIQAVHDWYVMPYAAYHEEKVPDYMEGLEKPELKDNNAVQLRKDFNELKANPYKDIRKYNRKKVLFFYVRTKLSKSDSTFHLNGSLKKLEKIEVDLAREEKALYEYNREVLAFYNNEKLKTAYLIWKSSQDTFRSSNLEIATRCKDLKVFSGLVGSLQKAEKEVAYCQLYGIDRMAWLDLQQNPYALNKMICQRAIANSDTLAINLLTLPQFQSKLMKAIYKTDNLDTAYAAHQVYRKRQECVEKARQEGKSIIAIMEMKAAAEAIVYTRDSLYLVRRAAQELIFKNSQKANSYYALSINQTRQYINCDYFPRMAPQELLVTSKVATNSTNVMGQAMMVFDRYKVVMPAHIYEGNGLWHNVPLDAAVNVVSIFIDGEGDLYLATAHNKISRTLPVLEYKKVSEQELKSALKSLNTTM